MKNFLKLSCSFFILISNAQAYTAMSLPGSLFSLTSEPPAGWANTGEAGLSLIGGNTESNQISLAYLTSYRWTSETLQLQLRYFEADAAQTQNAQRWMAGTRYERRLISHLGGFIGQSIESDRFAGFFQRYATDAGLRRPFQGDEKIKAAIEAGYRYQFENLKDGQLSAQIIRLFFEIAYLFTPTTNLVFATEALPDLKNIKDLRVNSEIDLNVFLTSVISFKNAFVFRYDTIPSGAGLKKTDRILTTSLVAKF